MNHAESEDRSDCRVDEDTDTITTKQQESAKDHRIQFENEDDDNVQVANKCEPNVETKTTVVKTNREKSGLWSRFRKFFPSSKATQAVDEVDVVADGDRDGPTLREIRRQISTVNQQQNTDVIFMSGLNKKKTLVNGLMDFAFLTANANQLHNALVNSNSDVIALISISIALQVLSSILMITTSYMLSKPQVEIDSSVAGYDVESGRVKQMDQLRRLNFLDHATIAIILLIAILNIFIASFGGNGSTPTQVSPPPVG